MMIGALLTNVVKAYISSVAPKAMFYRVIILWHMLCKD